MEFFPDFPYRLSNQWIMSTTKNERFNIAREVGKILMKKYVNLLSTHNPLFNKWDQSWCCNFLNMNGIICDMNSITVSSNPHGCLCSKNSDFFMTELKHLLCSWYHDTENMFSNKHLLLKPTECMNTCSIAGDNNHICSSSKESTHSISS